MFKWFVHWFSLVFSGDLWFVNGRLISVLELLDKCELEYKRILECNYKSDLCQKILWHQLHPICFHTNSSHVYHVKINFKIHVKIHFFFSSSLDLEAIINLALSYKFPFLHQCLPASRFHFPQVTLHSHLILGYPHLFCLLGFPNNAFGFECIKSIV